MFRKLLSLLRRGEKRRGALILVMVTVMAGLEMAGIASVMPFLSVLGNPEVVRENVWLSAVYERLGFQSVDDFLLALGVAAFVLILVSTGFRMLTHYAMNQFIEMRRHSISARLLETYLRQPYAYFLNRHSSDMAKAILSEVDQVVSQVFRPALEMIAYGVVLLGIVILLLIVDPVIAMVVTGVLAGIYALIYSAVRGLLGRIGSDRVHANRERFTAAGEALGGIKDIKLLGREQAYLSRFYQPSRRFARHQATNQTLSQVPNFLVEAVAFGGILILSLVLLAAEGGVDGGGLGEILPVLGVYAFAGLRMKPASKKIYAGLAKLRFGAAAVDNIYNDLHDREALAEIRGEAESPMPIREELSLKDVHFAYPGAENEALSGIDLTVPVGSAVGLVGTTGAGKTTLVDVLLGLLQPTRGTICVDGAAITEKNIRCYQQSLGYVPQDIFLTDSSVAENIALGVPSVKIDQDRVERCARMAQVHDFIMEDMPGQYQTVVGERGVRLSGGQRQRIGIARALYHDPQVLVFDEATSALDNVTEKAVMEAIHGLHKQKTIIMIAHRLSTVRDCDKVVLLDKGMVAGTGTYEELEKESDRFRAMAT